MIGAGGRDERTFMWSRRYRAPLTLKPAAPGQLQKWAGQVPVWGGDESSSSSAASSSAPAPTARPALGLSMGLLLELSAASSSSGVGSISEVDGSLPVSESLPCSSELQHKHAHTLKNIS